MDKSEKYLVKNIRYVVTNLFSSVEKAENEFKEALEEKAKYIEENKELLQEDHTSLVRRMYDRKIEDYDNRIAFKKNTYRYKLKELDSFNRKLKSMLEKYVIEDDEKRKEEKESLEQQIKEIRKEIEEIKKQKDAYPEYKRLYTEEGKSDIKELDKKMKDKADRIEELEIISTYFLKSDRKRTFDAIERALSDIRDETQEYNIELNDDSYIIEHELQTENKEPEVVPTVATAVPVTPPEVVPTVSATVPVTPPKVVPTVSATVPVTPPKTVSTMPIIAKSNFMRKIFDKIKSSRDDKIVIGSKGLIVLNGKKYKIPKYIMKNIATENNKDTLNNWIEEIGLEYRFDRKNTEKASSLVDVIEGTQTCDPLVIGAICSTNMDKSQKKLLVDKYIQLAKNAKNGSNTKNELNIIYDFNDLSKFDFGRWLKHVRIMNKNIYKLTGVKPTNKAILKDFKKALANIDGASIYKIKILKRAMIAERYGIAKINGEFKANKLLSKYLLKGQKELSIQDIIDDAHYIAQQYDEDRYENGKKRPEEEFRKRMSQRLEHSIKLPDFIREKKYGCQDKYGSLVDLVESQKKQEKDKEEDSR